MNRSDLIRALAEKSGSTHATAALVVDTVFETITAGLDTGARVEVRGFGTFRSKSYDGYMGRNPRTGAVVKVAAKRAPTFRASAVLSASINDSGE